MSKLQDFHNISDITGNDKVLVVRKNDQGLAKISDLPIKSDIPQSLRDDMNAVLNKKFGTGKTYPPLGWPDDVNLLGELKIKTASGAIASFPDGANDVPIKEGTFYIEPKQDLHGYNKPWPAGGGKNKLFSKDSSFTIGNTTFSVVNGILTIDGTTSAGISSLNTNFKSNFNFTLPAGTYYFYFPYSMWPSGTYDRSASVYPSTATSGSDALVANEGAFTLTEDTEVFIGLYIATDAPLSNFSPKCYLYSGSSASDYEPYSNICPISGSSQMTIRQTGKNLFDGSLSSSGSSYIECYGNVHTPSTVTTGLRVKKGVTYTISFSFPSALTNGIYGAYVSKKTLIVLKANTSTATPTVTFTAPEDDELCFWLYFPSGSTAPDVSLVTCQVEVGYTATTYEAYKAKTPITVSFGQTVYGGELETDGTLTKTWGYHKVASSETSIDFLAGTNNNGYRIGFDIANAEAPKYSGCLSNCFENKACLNSASWTIGAFCIYGTRIYIVCPNDCNTSQKCIDYLLSVNAEFAYPLATPQTYQLTPQELSTFLGYNNFYCDTGNTKIDYRSNGDVITPEPPSLITKTVTENGTYLAEDDEADGYYSFTVNVPEPPEPPAPEPPALDSKTVTSNGTYKAEDDELDGYSQVTVNVPGPDLGTKTITANGSYSASSDHLDGYSNVNVSVPSPTLGSKSVTQNGTYHASDDNVDGYNDITVNVGSPSLDVKTITANGTYMAQDDNLDGYSGVNVEVSGPTLIEKSITANGTYDASDDEADGYSSVTVNVPTHGDLLAMIQDNSLGNRLDCVDSVVKTQATKIKGSFFQNFWIHRIDLSTIIEIGGYAFYQSSASGREIKLHNCKTIGEYAFKDYSRSDDPINTIDFSSLETVGQYAFNRAKLQTRLVIPKCKTIGNNAFQECPLSGIDAPLLETIGQNAFASVWWSSDINLPSIKTIGNYAFAHTTSQNFTIGENCTYIGNEIFWSQAGVTNLYVLATTPPTLSSPFKNTSDGVQHIYVPADSVEDYKAASVWSNYASIIEGIEN